MKQKVFFGANGVLWGYGQFTVLFSWAPCLLEGGFDFVMERCVYLACCCLLFGGRRALQARAACSPGRAAVCSCHNLTVGAT